MIKNRIQLLLLLTVLSSFTSALTYGQDSHEGLTVLKSEGDRAQYKINDQWFINRWRISPSEANDVLSVPVFDSKEQIDFVFKTDVDSIKFTLKDKESKSFYVLLKDQYAKTTINRKAIVLDELKFDTKKSNPDYKIIYDTQNQYLDSLKKLYPIAYDKKQKNIDKVIAILDWTHNQWKHDGTKSPSKSDAITILNEVKEGGRFPCFSYAIVLASQLRIAGFKSRVLYIKRKDIETSQESGGHVVTEVYLNDLKKWVYVDGQLNIMPTLKGIPLNAVEFQEAIRNHYSALELRSLGKISKKDCITFTYPYLYYFDCAFDQRDKQGIEVKKVNGKRSLMLVPLGAKNPTLMFSYGSAKIDHCIYTNSIQDFYAKPE
ncbi:transglutaminase-like domain-containing protein [Flavobacterium sp. '19STA2R22 D10 B1']|uniref:transglutaminase-like domain-containing protein n=1 Tax=Flavobacterium aerium TaxID=3037261 RepID=UPI00278C5997|nr:transglutaminase-like domain-containing protein [Flavobacterium sp. '19STA2R22 D10 B1']